MPHCCRVTRKKPTENIYVGSCKLVCLRTAKMYKPQPRLSHFTDCFCPHTAGCRHNKCTDRVCALIHFIIISAPPAVFYPINVITVALLKYSQQLWEARAQYLTGSNTVFFLCSFEKDLNTGKKCSSRKCVSVKRSSVKQWRTLTRVSCIITT